VDRGVDEVQDKVRGADKVLGKARGVDKVLGVARDEEGDEVWVVVDARLVPAENAFALIAARLFRISRVCLVSR